MLKEIDRLKKRAIAVGIGDAINSYFERVNIELESIPKDARDSYLKESCQHLEEELSGIESCNRSMGVDKVPNSDAFEIETIKELGSQVEVIVD